MRSADACRGWRQRRRPAPPVLALALLVLLQGGCALWPGSEPAPAAPPPPVVVASPVPVPAAAAASAPAPAAVVDEKPAPPAPPPLPPIAAATQAAYDEAVRTLRAGRISEAERAFKALAARHPELAGVHANLGLVYRRQGKLEDSAAALQEAVKLSPRQAAFHNQLGITWRALGRFDFARKAYETAIDLDPTHAAALVNLAILNDLYLGEPARAAELYTRGAALLPGEAATINRWLAELKNRKADPKLAASAAAPAAAAPRKEKE